MTLKRILGLVGIIAVLLVCAYLLSRAHTTLIPPTSGSAKMGMAVIPPLTPGVQAQLAASHGFQALVSYTDRGFEPAKLTVKKGDTVRFTNNSGEDLWVASVGTASGTVYPAGTGDQCGQSAFDSCRVIGRGEFWEFAFAEAGTWSYRNNTDTKMTAVVRVK